MAIDGGDYVVIDNNEEDPDSMDEADFEVVDQAEEDSGNVFYLRVEVDPAELLRLTQDEILAAIGQIALANTQLRLRLMEILGKSAGKPDNPDHLLTVSEAATKLSVSKERAG